MKIFSELRVAGAACAAALGASFMSGREAATFFAVTGYASWAGVIAAALIFGAVMGMLCRFAQDTGAATLPAIYAAKMDERCGEAVSVVYILLMLMMGAVALSTSAELGMLSLEMKHPAAAAYVITLLLSLMLTLRGSISSAGVFIIPISILFLAILAADDRPALAGVYIQNELMDLNGNFSVSVFMGVMFAFLKAAVCGSLAAGYCRGISPRRFGIICGVIMFMAAALANSALQRAGETVWALNLPFVVLSARFGVFGYYISIYIMWLGCLSVLTCALDSVAAMFPKRFGRTWALCAAATGISVMSAAGLKPLVSTGYPLLGWAFAMCIMALSVFYERKKPASSSSFPIK